MIQVVMLKFSNHLLRELGQKSEGILCINNKRLSRPTGEMFEIGHRADRLPQLAQPVDVHLRLETLANVPRGLPVPDYVGNISGRVIECRDLNSRVVRGSEECVARA